MSSRTATWLMIFGGLLGFVGLCIMPAGLGNHGDRSMLGLGTTAFGIGALFLAGGIYLKALMFSSKAVGNAPSAANSKRHPRGACDLCRSEMPVIHCKVHQFHLCSACLAQHYDFRACVYVPSTRRAEPKNTKNSAFKAHA